MPRPVRSLAARNVGLRQPLNVGPLHCYVVIRRAEPPNDYARFLTINPAAFVEGDFDRFALAGTHAVEPKGSLFPKPLNEPARVGCSEKVCRVGDRNPLVLCHFPRARETPVSGRGEASGLLSLVGSSAYLCASLVVAYATLARNPCQAGRLNVSKLSLAPRLQ